MGPSECPAKGQGHPELPSTRTRVSSCRAQLVMICRETCQQSSGTTVFGTGVSQSCPVCAAQRCRRGSRCSATSERAPQNHGSQFPTGLTLAQPHLATAKALCSLLPLSQLETTLQANRTGISNPWPTPVLPTGPGPAGLRPPTSHGAVHPQLRDTAAPPAPALPHRPGGDTAPLVGRSQSSLPSCTGQDPQPRGGGAAATGCPSQEEGAQASKPSLCPCSPRTGHSATRCQALATQPSLWLRAAQPLPGSARPAAWPRGPCPWQAGQVGQPGSTCVLALRDTGAPVVLLGHNRLVLVPIPVCSLLLLGWTQTHGQPTLPAGPA